MEHTSHSPVIENTEKFETNDRDLNVVDTNETEDINNEVSLHKDYNDSNSDISQDKDLVQSTNLHSEPVTGATADFDIPPEHNQLSTLILLNLDLNWKEYQIVSK